MNFSDFKLNKALINALNDKGLITPTEIQKEAFPIIMSGKDFIGIAQTGTGKTIAYLLPLLNLWKFTNDKKPQFLILVPTKELVVQVQKTVEELTKYMSFKSLPIFGGNNIKQDIKNLENGADMVIASPGRFIELAMTKNLKVSSIKKFVIDEVDEMLNSGFQKQLLEVMDLIPQRRQNLMFSATLLPEVKEFINQHFTNFELIEISENNTTLVNIKEEFFEAPNFYTKINFLKDEIKSNKNERRIVFTSRKKLAKLIFQELNDENTRLITSNKEQNTRLKTIESFEKSEFNTLIATDIVARGVDIEDIDTIINLDFPKNPEAYIHRIGRTGRAGKNGSAITLVSPYEMEKFEEFQAYFKEKIELLKLPSNIEVSEIELEFEQEEINMPTVDFKNKKKKLSGPAFHEKKEKNKKVNVRVNHKEEMKKKYGKLKSPWKK